MTRLHGLITIMGVALTMTLGTMILTGLWSMQSVWETLYAGRWYLVSITYILTWWTTGKSPFRLLRGATYFAEAAEKAVLDVVREIPGELRARFPECLEQVKEEA